MKRPEPLPILVLLLARPDDRVMPQLEELVRIEIKGVATIAPEGVAIVLAASNPTDTNSIAEPTKIVPVTTKVTGLGTSFTRTLAPNSVTVLQLPTH